MKKIGVDIGGTKVAICLLDESGVLVYKATYPSDPSDKEAMYDVVNGAIGTLLAEKELDPSEVSIGLGVPGIVDPEGGRRNFSKQPSVG